MNKKYELYMYHNKRKSWVGTSEKLLLYKNLLITLYQRRMFDIRLPASLNIRYTVL